MEQSLFPTQGSAPSTWNDEGPPPSTWNDEGPQNFYPPVCNQFHFDPTQIIKHTLPDESYTIPLPLGPRPWTKICLDYVNSTTNEPAPKLDPTIAFPAGGFFQDPNRYLDSIDSESHLRRLNQPLRKCDASQYEPNNNGDMFNNRLLVPTTSKFQHDIPEIAMPKVLLTAGPYKCRSEADAVNMSLSSKPFFNSTKQDRYYNKSTSVHK